jgi:hypothetical protein
MILFIISNCELSVQILRFNNYKKNKISHSKSIITQIIWYHNNNNIPLNIIYIKMLQYLFLSTYNIQIKMHLSSQVYVIYKSYIVK